MNFYELAQNRYSARKYQNKKIEDEKITKILEAGRLAPTAVNFQPQRIYVLKSEEALKKINEITPYAFQAPLVMLVCGNVKEAWTNPHNSRNSAEMDASIVATHMMLQAKELGIDSCWVCYFNTEQVKKEFNLAENEEPYLLMPMGYSDEKLGLPSPKHSQRKPLDETVKYL